MRQRKKYAVLSGAFSALIIWITLLCRTKGDYGIYLTPFQSYQKMMDGSIGFGVDAIGNILLFVPFAYCTLGVIFHSVKFRHVFVITLMGASLSIVIEMMQFAFSIGYFEVDDIFNNLLGCLIGAWLQYANMCIFKRKATTTDKTD